MGSYDTKLGFFLGLLFIATNPLIYEWLYKPLNTFTIVLTIITIFLWIVWIIAFTKNRKKKKHEQNSDLDNTRHSEERKVS